MIIKRGVQAVFILNIQQHLRRKIKRVQNEKGFALPFFVMIMFTIVLCFAFLVDLGNVLVVRHKIQTVADAGSLAGASKTKVTGVYDASGNVTGYSAIVDLPAAQMEANDYIQKNLDDITLDNPRVTIVNVIIDSPTSKDVHVEIDYTIKPLLLKAVTGNTSLETISTQVRSTAELKI